MSNGKTEEIKNLVNEKVEIPEVKPGSIVTVNATTGEIEIDGKGTGFFAAKSQLGEIKVPYINAEGELITFDEEGNEVKTGIKKNEVVAVANPDGSYTLSIPGTDGKLISIKLPSPASAITAMVVADNADTKLTLKNYKFTFTDPALTPLTRDTWKGKKALPKDNEFVVSSTQELSLKLSPASVNGEELSYTLINSKGKTPANVSLKATKAGRDASGSRAASNGLYNLTFVQTIVNDMTAFDEKFGANAKGEWFAVNANNTFRSYYNVQIAKFTDLTNGDTAGAVDATITLDGATSALSPKSGSTYVIDAQKTYLLGSNNDAETYDLFFDYEKPEDKNIFGVVEGEDGKSLKVTSNPEKLTAASFNINVYLMDVNGKITTKTLTLELSSKLNASTNYDLVSHTINSDAAKNMFIIDLAKMKTELGGSLDVWSREVSLSATTMVVKNGLKTVNSGNVIAAPVFLKKDTTPATTGSEAQYAVFVVDNSLQSVSSGLNLTDEFKITVTFNKTGGTDVLNSIVVPVKFTAPTVASMFTPAPGYVKDGVINAYFEVDKYAIGNIDGVTPVAYVTFEKYFDNYSKASAGDITVSIDDKEKIGDDKVNTLVKVGSSLTFANTWIGFPAKFDAAKNEAPKAYGQVFTVHVKQPKFNNWVYAEGDDTYSFKMRLASPIYDGTIVPAEGTSITLKANDLTEGVIIKASDIIGKDYAGNAFNVVPDTYVDGTKCAWSNPQVASVAIEKGQYMTAANLVPVTKDAKGNEVAGGFKLTAETISSDCTSTLTVKVTDKWGYILTKEVTINIKK